MCIIYQSLAFNSSYKNRSTVLNKVLDLASYLLIFRTVLPPVTLMSEPQQPVIIDSKGQPCPMPLLMLKRTMKRQPNVSYLLQSSDPHSQQDVIRYCQIQGLSCQMTEISQVEFHYLIES